MSRRTVKEVLVAALCAVALLLLIGMVSKAKAQTALPEPVCAPKPFGTGSYQKRIDVADVGSAFVYWCPLRYEYSPVILYQAKGYVLKHPDTKGMTLEQTRTAYWNANATTPATDPSVKPLWDAGYANVINQPAPPIVWKVSSNGSSTTRPAYKYSVSGTTLTRSSTADPVKRAPVGAPCDAVVRDKATTSAEYMRFEDGWMAACTRAPANQQPLY